ncbi:CS1 type fimbrial major subunit [Pseudomonas sp. PB3P13]
MNKQCAVVALMAITGLMSQAAWSAREEHTFEVSVIVPSRSFYVIPSDPGWIHQAQRLNWNYTTSNMGSLRKYFDVLHDTSAIEARLDTSPYLSNGRPGEEIALRVKFNNVELSASAQPRQVVSQAEAAMGSRVLLDIQPVKPPGGYKPGDYDGSVLLLFSAKAP